MNPFISRLLNIISLACIIFSIWGVIGCLARDFNDDEFIGMSLTFIIPLVLNYLVLGKVKLFTSQ